MTITRPNPELFGHFSSYIALAPEGDLAGFMERQLAEMRGLLDGLPEAESLVHHAPYTWSIREVVGHITDCERVFGMRTLWLARGNEKPLPGFDEKQFMTASAFDRWPLGELLAEFEGLRRSHIWMVRHMEPEACERKGTISEVTMTAAAMAYATAGHAEHHLQILHKRLGR